MNYILSIHNRRMFREIRLGTDRTSILIGTEPGCDIRLNANAFPEPVKLFLENTQGGWQLSCAGGQFLDGGDVRKPVSVPLHNNSSFSLVDAKTRRKLLEVDFSPDFDDRKDYARCIDLTGIRVLTMGASERNSLVLTGRFTQQDAVVLKRTGTGPFEADVLKCAEGFLINAKPAAIGDLIRSGDFFSVADYFFYYENDRLWTANRNDLKINGLFCADEPERPLYPLFNRKTRFKPVFDKTPVTVIDPPQVPEKRSGNILFRMLPSLGMLAAASVMALRGYGTMLVFSGITAGTAMVTAAAGLVRDKREYRKELEKRKETYEQYIKEKRKEITRYRNRERKTAVQLYCPVEELLSRIDTFSPELFDRKTEDDDFLCVRIGTGTVKAGKKLEYRHQERLNAGDELQQIPEKLSAEFENIKNCPVVCDLREINALGICGSSRERSFFVKNMIIDIAARHLWTDVKMIFAAESENAAQITGYRMLPHVSFEDAHLRGIVADEESRDHVFEYLYKELSRREVSGSKNPRIVVFLYDDAGFSSHPLSLFTGKAMSLGAVFIHLKAQADRIPEGCAGVIMLKEGENTPAGCSGKSGKGTFIRADSAEEKTEFEYGHISEEAMERAVSLLAPVYTREVTLGSRLETYISLFSLFGIYNAQEMDLEKRWNSSDINASMAVPVGCSNSGVLYLDIHDRAMGPHGLIAGTTGSGKSELLQTFILSTACTFSPSEAAFLIIDFKGGGMAASLKELPHIAGVITNIDEKEITRSLRSIKAELVRRQKLFEETGVNHIDSYIKKYKEGKTENALPHLIIIADEFAELKAQHPEFMKELISAARIGRSLGVHLILATQKPSGQVDEQIWSNSRFRICLRVQNSGDSNEVLKSPLAAQIREPGRAYLQVGNHELFELFQSACSAGPALREDGSSRDFRICKVGISGKRTPVFEKRQYKEDREGSAPEMNEAKALTKHIQNYCDRNHIPAAQAIVKPVLEQNIEFPAAQERKREESSGLWAQIGIYDAPDRQFRGEYRLDLSKHNLMITGSSRSGKTNLLCSLVRSLSGRYPAEELSIYMIDYASMSLKAFEGLKTVGAVVCTGDEEGTGQMFRFLTRQLQLRKDMMSRKFREKAKLPHILLIIDNLTALKEVFLQDDSQLLRICREGISAGISVVAANPGISGIGYRYLADFSARIALHLNESAEYGYLFGKCVLRPSDTPGRCVIEMNREQYECQVYKAFAQDAEGREAAELEAFIHEVNARNETCAKKVPVIPELLTQKALEELCEGSRCRRFEIAAGLDYENVEPCMTDLSEIFLLAVAGKKGSGRHNWIRYAVEVLSGKGAETVKIYAADGYERRLDWLEGHPSCAAYSINPGDCAEFVIRIRDLLRERYEKLSACGPDFLKKEPLLILLLDNTDAAGAVCADEQALKAYREITLRYKALHVCMILCVENSGISYHTPEILKNIREEKQCLYFDDIRNFRLFDIPAALQRNRNRPFAKGDAFYIKNTELFRLKTPLACPGEPEKQS